MSPGTPGGIINGGLNQAATAGATAVRLASTTGRAVGDELILDPVGGTRETVRIASIPSPAPASPAPNVTLQSPLQYDHAAATVVQPFTQYRNFPIQIDTKAPTAAWPAGVATNNRIGHGAANITPTRTDPSRRLGQPGRARGLARRPVGLPAAAGPLQALARQAHLGAEHHRLRRQRQQGQVHVPRR